MITSAASCRMRFPTSNADRHDGAYPDEKYLNEETERRFAERTGMATPESAQA